MSPSTSDLTGSPDIPFKNRYPRISVCIPAYNEESNLQELIDFVFSLPSIKDDLDEIIVDISGSTDSSRTILNTLSYKYGKINVIDVGIRDGLVRSIQRLLSSAEGDIIVRLDADLMLQWDTLDKLIAEFSSEDVGIVSPQIIPFCTLSSFVERIYSVSYKIHHLVCLISPKTTNLQVFRNIRDFEFPPSAQVEDILLQDMIVSKGYRAKYIPTAVVYINPPSNLKEYVRQRLRNIEIRKWYKNFSGNTTPTQNMSLVSKSILDGLRLKPIPFTISSLFEFLFLEAICISFVYIRDIILGPPIYKPWEPIQGTKRKHNNHNNNGEGT